MIAESLKQDSLPNQLLWSGEVRRAKWKIYCIEIVHPNEDYSEAILVSSSDSFWRLRFNREDGEFFETTWFPKERIIFGTLSGRSKSAIGDLKNALIQHRWQAYKSKI
ncbi:hypothetical protein NIES25_11320 [Nostoc linckia NIES-25]|nr:hypothetical protein NIES25_11320 [Nostoc linckia NIES-25]